jgi:hypothetical protein
VLPDIIIITIINHGQIQHPSQRTAAYSAVLLLLIIIIETTTAAQS